jgi:hypothetical protein
MPIELELTYLCLELQAEELNSMDIHQRMNSLLSLEEQRIHALDNLKRRRHTIKKYFNKKNLLILRLMRKCYSEIQLMLREEDIPSFKNYG